MTCILLAPSGSFIPPLTGLAIKNRFATCEDDVLPLTYRNKPARDALYDFTDRIDKKLESDHIAGNLCCGLVAGIHSKEVVDPVTNNDFGSIVAGLMLIFPEIRWYFLGIEGLPSILEEPDKRQRYLFSPLFDADGVRAELIEKALGTYSQTKPKPPDCVVVEDELNFCFYYSYVAYRTGYRVLPISSFTAFKNVKNWFPDCSPPTVLIEDMSLAFFDKEEQESLILLEERDGVREEQPVWRCNYGAISEKAKLRALVTIGQPPSGEKAYKDALNKNRDYLKKCQKRKVISANTHIECDKTYFAEEPKPIGGIFRLVELLALKKFISGDDKTGREPRHSAPGMVQAIVEVMLSRIRKRRNREGLLDILLGSILSIDALRLMDTKAPMLRFDALFSQHENEVRAESQFIDIGPVRDVEQRLEDISEKIKMIAEACQEESQHRVELQAQATLAHRMMLVFRSAAQYEEEMVCLNYLRKAQRRLNRLPSLKSRGWLRILERCVKSILLLPRTYAELLVSGGYLLPILAMVGWALFLNVVDIVSDEYWRLAVAMLGWPLGVAIVYWRRIRKFVGWVVLLLSLVVALWIGETALPDTTATTWKRISAHFFEAEAAPEKSVDLSENLFGLLVVLIGVFHIGVFISFVFSRLMRR